MFYGKQVDTDWCVWSLFYLVLFCLLYFVVLFIVFYLFYIYLKCLSFVFFCVLFLLLFSKALEIHINFSWPNDHKKGQAMIYLFIWKQSILICFVCSILFRFVLCFTFYWLLQKMTGRNIMEINSEKVGTNIENPTQCRFMSILNQYMSQKCHLNMF